MKRAQIQSQIFIYVGTAVLIVLILIFSFKAIAGLGKKNRIAQVIEFEEKLKSIVDLLSQDFGAAQQVELRVPTDVDTVCFVDLNQRDHILNNSALPKTYPEIKSSLQNYVLKNTFLISQLKVTDSFYAGNLCLEPPFFKCIDTPDHVLRMIVKGKKNCVSIIKPIRQLPINNEKNITKYDPVNPMFMIEDLQGNNNILKLVPIAMWNNQQQGITSDPLYVFHSKDAKDYHSDFDLLMTKKYNYGTPGGVGQMRFFATVPPYITTGTLSTSQYYLEDFSNYYGYWTKIVDLVVVPTQDVNGSLISSLFSSYLIAPLLFVNRTNLDVNKPMLANKRVYVVDSGKMDKEVNDYLDKNAKEYIPDYDAEVLRVESDLNPYKELVSNILPSTALQP